MNEKPKYYNERIVAFDVLRAVAVLLMIEGHTVHVFLDSTLRSSESLFYLFWVFLRGFTAPLFMFTAGLVYVYLLVDVKKKTHSENRLQKGFRRGLMLIALGYLLRFPTFNILRWSHLPEARINTFASVDALHIIGLGLILLNLIVLLSEKLDFNLIVLLAVSVVATVAAKFILNDSYLINKLPLFIKSYFTCKNGTIFTLFPWLGYISLGGVFGVIFKNNNLKKRSKLFILSVSFLILIIALFFNNSGANYIVTSIALIVTRMSAVVFILVLLNLSLSNKRRLPKSIMALGRNSLLIYVVHLVILYGSPVSIGFYQIVPEQFSLMFTLLAVVVMEVLMIYVALYKERRENKFLGKNIFYGKVFKYRSELKF